MAPPEGVVAGVVGVTDGLVAVLAGAVVVAPGSTAPGVLVAGAAAVGVNGVLALAGPVVVIVVVAVELEPPASLTSAAASTPRASAAVTAIAVTGAFQLGVAERRVRAAAPQRRHQS